VKDHITDAYCIHDIFHFHDLTIFSYIIFSVKVEKYIVKYDKKMHGFQIFLHGFQIQFQFFDVPFGVFHREIAGNGHSRLLKFKISRGNMPPDPPRMGES
jgi:hypothetical protein